MLVEPPRQRSGLQLFDPPGDLLPGSDALLIACEHKRADLLGNVEGGLIPMGLEH